MIMDLLTVYTEEELKKIQRIELEALKEIVSICDKLHIEYFLIGGSVLGAIRHNGFIPWDDDIDIGMPREDYRRFLTEVPSLLPSNYHLQSPYEGTLCPYFYSKVRINDTLFMEYCNRTLPIHHGVYIDIFPFDNVPDNEYENTIQFNSMQKMIRLFTLRQIPDVSMQPVGLSQKMKSIIRRILHILSKMIPYSVLIHKMEKEMTRYNDTETRAMACLNFPIRKTEYILKSDLYPLIKYTFEDTVFYIPHNWDAYLKTHYDDYMKMPKFEKRYGHKPYKVRLD